MNRVYVSDLICANDTFEEELSFLTENNITNIEFFVEPADSKHSEKLLKLLDVIDSTDVSLHGPYRMSAFTDSEDSWQKTLSCYSNCIDLCAKHNFEFVVVHTNEALEPHHSKEVIETRLREVVDLANSKGVTILVENVGVGKNMLYNEEEFIKLVEDNDYKVLIDFGHFLVNGWDVDRVLERLKDRIVAYHIHNNDGVGDRHQSIFDGVFDYAPVIKSIQKHTPDANIALEYSAITDKNVLLEDLKKIEELLK